MGPREQEIRKKHGLSMNSDLDLQQLSLLEREDLLCERSQQAIKHIHATDPTWAVENQKQMQMNARL